jgi:hypothetical protein
MTSHLVIPDSHAHPDYHNERYKWVGQLVADIKPDVVVSIGDWADMPSLSSYDKGTKGFEGKRYYKDVAAAHEAQEFFFEPIRKRKKKRPRFIQLEGNHEYRIKRAIEADAAHLDGVIGVGDLGYADFGWEFVEYEGSTPGIIKVDGISYAHYFTSGVMGRAVSGVNPAYALVTKYGRSCTMGHTHCYAHYHRSNPVSECIGLVAGVYQDYYSEYAGAANEMWWRGVVLCENVEDGVYDVQQISLDSLRKAYG